jgi:cob(I)alamin adenosyltransferase
VEAYGALDEANSWIGLARASITDPTLATLGQALEFLQHRFCNCSSNLAFPPGSHSARPTVSEEDVAFLEATIDRFEARTGPIRHFIVPGGRREAALLHVARTVCRRAERRMLTLAEEESVDPMVRAFVNRASDFLFAAARYACAGTGCEEVVWNQDLPRPEV